MRQFLNFTIFFLTLLSNYVYKTYYFSGYDVDVNGITFYGGNQYIDYNNNDQLTDCPSSCTSCSNSDYCLTCTYGYFLYTPMDNNHQLCLKCPHFHLSEISQTVGCADCVSNPLTWSSKMICTYIFQAIDLGDPSLIRYQKIQTLDTKSLFYVYRDNQDRLAIRDCPGCDSWCGDQLNAKGCQTTNLSFQVPVFQQGIICKKGYYFSQNGCSKCIDNCDICSDSSKCLVCSSGYSIGLGRICVSCSSVIVNCLNCYLGNSNTNFIQDQTTLDDYTQDMLDQQGFLWRCASCNQKNIFYIPSLDQTTCESCDLNNCRACRYATVIQDQLIDHTSSPYVVDASAQDSFQKYCTLCQASYSVKYDGQCRFCSSQCSICYYGSLSGDNILYTLENDFLYLTQQQKNELGLQWKCFGCIYNSNNDSTKFLTGFDGQCVLESDFNTQNGVNLNFAVKDPNCFKWRQLTSSTSTQFECIECINGYGINMANPSQQRLCDLSVSSFNNPSLSKCLSFYYTFQGYSRQLISCTSCQQGYSPLPSKGCVNCSSGKIASSEPSDAPNATCNDCHHISSSGLDFTIVLKTTQFVSQDQALEQENQQSFPVIPQCIDCANNLVDGRCPNLCQSYCLNSQCIPDESGYSTCQACVNVQFQYDDVGLWTTSESLSQDQSSCLICPRYCDLCVERTSDEMKSMNPYFKSIDQFFGQFQYKCLVCKSVENSCLYPNGSLGLDCNNQSASTIFYDARVNQCYPCQGSDCARKIKIRQIIECRSGQAAGKENMSQSDYYKTVDATGADFGDEVFPLSVIFIEKWNPTQQLTVDFFPYTDIRGDIYFQLNAINGEGISTFEYEILIIPEQNVSINIQSNTNVYENVCRFPNEITFTNSLAKYVANINSMKLSFSILTSAGVKQNVELAFLYTNGFTFSGWNEFYFSYLTFIPLLNLKKGILPNDMLIKFSDNLFNSKVTFNQINFIHGVDLDTQQNTFKKLKTNCYPVIEVANMQVLQIIDLKLQNFFYPSTYSLFNFVNTTSSQSFNMIVDGMEINNCKFSNTNFIQLVASTASIKISNFKMTQNFFDQSAILYQAQGHNFPVSQHTITISSTDITSQTLNCFKFIDAYNMLTTQVQQFAFYDQIQISCNNDIPSLFTSNIINCDTVSIKHSNKPFILRIVQFPVASPSQISPIIILNNFTLEGLILSNIFGQLINLVQYQFTNNYSQDPYNLKINQFTVKGLSCINQFEFGQTNLIYLKQISKILIKNLNIIDTKQVNVIFADTVSYLDIQQGSYQRSVQPKNWDFKNGFLQNLPNSDLSELNGYFLQSTTLINRVFIQGFTFSYLFFRDTNLVQNTQIASSNNNLPKTEYNDDQIESILVNKAKNLDYGELAIPRIIITDCTFENLFSITASQKQISLINIEGDNSVRLILDQVVSNQISAETLLEQLIKESASFALVDSMDSYFHIYGSNFSNFKTSVCLQNGFVGSLNKIFILDSHFTQANMQYLTLDNSLKGGYFNIQANYFSIKDSTFQQVVADTAGAIYYKGLTYSQLICDTVTFDQIYTSFSPLANGNGGAIYYDSQSTISSLTITGSTFTDVYANYTGGALYLICGKSQCVQMIQQNTFSNVFANQGSIFYIQHKLPAQSTTFQLNTITQDMDKLKNVLTQYYQFQDIDAKTLQDDLQLFYLMIMIGGVFNFQSNTLSGIQTVQGFIYGQQIVFKSNQNKISQSNFYFTPYIYLAGSYFNSNTFEFDDISFCNDCVKDPVFSFLNTASAFDSFILIENPTQQTFVTDIIMNKVICGVCSQGLLGFTKVSNQITLQKGDIQNCESNQGIIYIKAAVSNKRNLQTAQQISTIDGYKFQNNLAMYGTAIYSSNCSLIVQNSQITSNQATDTAGGLYFYSAENIQNTLKLINTQITQNSAKYAGGIKCIGTFAQLLQGSTVEMNTATYGKDIVAYPVGLILSVNGTEHQPDQDGIVRISNWASGTSDYQDMGFYFISSDNKKQILQADQTSSLTVSLNYGSSSVPSTAKILGTQTAKYDQIYNGFVLDKIILQQYPLQQLLIKASSPTVQIPVFDSDGTLISVKNDYILQMIIQMRKCTVGEAYIEITGNCFYCSKGTYSLLTESKQCLNCPKYGVENCPGGNQMNLTDGYWRPDETSDLIESCFNYESNCLGGLKTGDSSCAEGHIGALCEVCDITGREWGESYSFSSNFKCGKCSEVVGNTFKMIGLSIYTFLAIIFSVRSTKALLDSYIITFYLQKINFLPKKAVQNQESVGIIIKIFTTYIQLLLVIQTFKLQLPPGLRDISASIGDPVQQMSFSMDCALYQMQKKIPITYFRLLWAQFMPIIYVSLYLLGHYIYINIKRFRFHNVTAWISIIYMFISMQPSIVRTHIQTSSCRFISGENYIKADVSQICYTNTHIGWMVFYILPTLLVWIVLIPLFFLYNMHKGKKDLNKIRMQYRFGFLYSEYKQTSYFWEIVKIYQKTLVTIFINIFDQYISIKGILVIFILILYIYLQKKNSPYLEKRFNNLDIQSNLTVIVSIILAIFILDNPFAYQIWLAYTALILLNVYFIIIMLGILISGLTSKFESKLYEIYLKISKKFPSLSKLLRLPRIPKERIKYLWGCIRMSVIKHKQNENQQEKQIAKKASIEVQSLSEENRNDQVVDTPDNQNYEQNKLIIVSSQRIGLHNKNPSARVIPVSSSNQNQNINYSPVSLLNLQNMKTEQEMHNTIFQSSIFKAEFNQISQKTINIQNQNSQS
ncbi:transmembrane protein, putative (macronuclear) [Tetrahymena thermophila SB210]|uniref:Transmembrane protein, putative n=1 Tax=Tetrahymena thermophila (strain SB210) TaxID=312017 RepID=I7M2P8_TETTS|nr:transmembrane protein, putative [Tetrahymena thermophila SB210]EAS01067.2 transmembrane protein, putative [Tetrahymena thermophila SB210]|eukprot:XP_001021312.2 transmembrane protein, putative [Tetrahymena thermophila SB210]